MSDTETEVAINSADEIEKEEEGGAVDSKVEEGREKDGDVIIFDLCPLSK